MKCAQRQMPSHAPNQQNKDAIFVRRPNFIPLSRPPLEALLKHQLPPSLHARWKDLHELVSAHIHFESHAKNSKLKELFIDLMDDRAGAAAGAESEALTRKRDQFVAGFMEVCALANFDVLTQKEWEMAQAEDFHFSVPMSIHWNKYDAGLLRQYADQHQEWLQGSADFTRRCVVLHRGLGEKKLSGAFYEQKLDLFLRYTLFQPLERLQVAVRRALGLNHAEAAAAAAAAAARSAAPANGHTHCIRVERKSLCMLMPDARSVLANLTQVFNIVEPTFDRVLVLWRDAPPAAAAAATAKVAGSGGAGGKGNGGAPAAAPAVAVRPVRMKSFTDVPMADVDIVFPHMSIEVPRLSTVTWYVMLVVTLVTSWLQFSQAQDDSDDGGDGGQGDGWDVHPSWLVIGALVAKLFQMNSDMRIAQQRARDSMTAMLYASALDSDMALLAETVDGMEDQEYKEVLLGYWTLCQSYPRFRTPDEMDKDVEDLLNEQQGMSVDFEVEDALRKLKQLGIVEEQIVSGLPPRYRALDIGDALELLNSKWDDVFDYNDAAAPS